MHFLRLMWIIIFQFRKEKQILKMRNLVQKIMRKICSL